MSTDNRIILENSKDYKNITKEFYTILERSLEKEFPDDYISYKIGIIDFQTLILKVKNSIDKSTKQRDKDLIDKLNYLLNNNYILNS